MGMVANLTVKLKLLKTVQI